MNEYVTKQEARTALLQRAWKPNEWHDIKSLIFSIPPADVRPVVRSHWKKNDNGTYSCERCHSWIPKEQRRYANWCLYCGADMRGGDAE